MAHWAVGGQGQSKASPSQTGAVSTYLGTWGSTGRGHSGAWHRLWVDSRPRSTSRSHPRNRREDKGDEPQEGWCSRAAVSLGRYLAVAGVARAV